MPQGKAWRVYPADQHSFPSMNSSVYSAIAECGQMADPAVIEQGRSDKSFAGNFQFVAQGQGRNPWLGRTAQPLDESLGMARWGWLGGGRITQGIEEIGVRQSIPKRLERRRGIEQIHADDPVVAANQDARSPFRQHQAFGSVPSMSPRRHRMHRSKRPFRIERKRQTGRLALHPRPRPGRWPQCRLPNDSGGPPSASCCEAKAGHRTSTRNAGTCIASGPLPRN